VYGAVAGAGGAVGLLLGGVLTEYLSWRWCLYMNLIAAFAVAGAVLLLRRQPAAGEGPDRPGRRRPGLRRQVLRGLRLLQRRPAQLAYGCHLGFHRRRPDLAGRLRVVAGPRGGPAAAAQDRAETPSDSYDKPANYPAQFEKLWHVS
jgi:MFS family permease